MVTMLRNIFSSRWSHGGHVDLKLIIDIFCLNILVILLLGSIDLNNAWTCVNRRRIRSLLNFDWYYFRPFKPKPYEYKNCGNDANGYNQELSLRTLCLIFILWFVYRYIIFTRKSKATFIVSRPRFVMIFVANMAFV